jgi:hypothetical protein
VAWPGQITANIEARSDAITVDLLTNLRENLGPRSSLRPPLAVRDPTIPEET